VRTILTDPTVLFIALAWAAFLLFWVFSALAARPMRWLNVALALIMIAAVTSLFFLLQQSAVLEGYNPRLWQRSLLLGIAGDIVVLAGVLLFVWARHTLGSNWNAGAAAEQELVQSGPYAYVRHPIYSGFLTMALGTAMTYGRLLGVLILVASVAGLYLRAMREESLLLVKFPTSYRPYKERTKALIPYLL
jgi:protein-S-isoprenylcysteine O-methyltransferase Ste14